MNKRIIITDHLHPYLAEQLQEMGFEVDIQADITNEELYPIIGQYIGLVLSTKIKVTTSLIDLATKLKFIARAGSGMENIDYEYAGSKNIKVINSPEGNANAVAEHVIGFLFAMLNNIVKADRDIRKGLWQREENRGDELDGKTIGIIGFGNTGSALASKLQCLNVKILAYDKYKEGFGNEYVKEVTLEEIKEHAEIITFHVPLTEETHYYLDFGFIESMRNNFWLINASRGKIVKTEALLSGIRSGKIFGAALDVFENEQFYQLEGREKEIMEELCHFENIILSPHIAGWSRESHYKISKILAERIEALAL